MKKNFFKKFSSTLISGSLILTSVMPQCSIFAANENNRATQLPQKGIDWDYDENNKTLTILSDKAMVNYNGLYLREQNDNRPWKNIISEIKVVKIGKDVTKIGNCAFSKFCNLLKVEFSSDTKVNSIGKLAFWHCTNLTKFIIPRSVKIIKTCAFLKCNLTANDVIFEEINNLEKVEMGAFPRGFNLSNKTFLMPQ